MSHLLNFPKWTAAVGVMAATLAFAAHAQEKQSAGQPPKVIVDQDGTVHVPAYAIPLSAYMSEEAKRAYIDLRLHWPSDATVSSDIAKTREAVDRVWLMPYLERARAVYPVTVEEKSIAGVRTYIVMPAGGVAKPNEDRVLINLHGGGFRMGAGVLQLIEAIPIAAAARIKVISLDYRQSPEHQFPAASEDVAAVYKELLKQYPPRHIGIYGHSSGGMLTAMSMAWFQKEKLSLPGAIGIFSAHGVVNGGDSFYLATPLVPLFSSRSPAPPVAPNPSPLPRAYFAGSDVSDPLVSPVLHPEVLAKFPPTLIVTGTRDALASGLIHTHRQLVRAGVDSQLEIWEGMWHAFIQDVDLPESKEMYDVTAKFFAAHLGKLSQSPSSGLSSGK